MSSSSVSLASSLKFRSIGAFVRNAEIKKNSLTLNKPTDLITCVLALPVISKKNFMLETKLSSGCLVLVGLTSAGVGIGVVLQQGRHPIAYLSKTLATKHPALSTYEKDFLAASYSQDTSLQKVIQQLGNRTFANNKYHWDGNVLKRKRKLVVGNDEQLRAIIMQHYHADAVRRYSVMTIIAHKVGSFLSTFQILGIPVHCGRCLEGMAT
ncbi:hypothetical protein Tco_1395793 [Tanacetum coccineum]